MIILALLNCTSDHYLDKSGVNTAAIKSYHAEQATDITLRQVKYLNHIVEQDHRAVKRIVRSMLGFKSFGSARITLASIELMYMIKKSQIHSCALCQTAAQQFYSLAAKCS